jgi:arsenical pump membrane protein
MNLSGYAILMICLAATAGVLIRPWRLPEAIWACLGAAALVASGLLAWRSAVAAVGRGGDVYLFLIGMMLLSELARREGLFDWLATHAVGWAAGSRARLFALVYAIGVIVTAFLSNDATAVVLTPAVYAAARKAEADPLPALFACALVANAASFVLPISNPANLVLYGGRVPPLGVWLSAFALPSLAAIVVTFAMLRLVERKRIAGVCLAEADGPKLSAGAGVALGGIVLTGVMLLTVSALGQPLGLPTFFAGAATALALTVWHPGEAWATLRGVSWSVLPLVAGLFVLVAGLAQTGLIAALSHTLADGAARSPQDTAAGAGTIVAVASNLINNLPAGLIASTAIAQAHPPQMVTDSLLIGVDLGPNLSVTGSLATILWLTAIRREGEDVSVWRFLKVGAAVMPPALAVALVVRVVLG